MEQTTIRALRTARGMTLKDVADKVGTTAVTVSRWEREPQRVTVPVLANLARVLDVHPSELLASATGSAIKDSNRQEISTKHQHDVDIIHELTGLNAENMSVITAVTDTMAPTIMPGDMCLVEGMAKIGRAGIYAVRNNDVSAFCRVLPQGTFSLMVTLDNPLYPLNIAAKPDEFTSTIIGRVISITKKV